MKKKITYWIFVFAFLQIILPFLSGEGLGVRSFGQSVSSQLIGTTGNYFEQVGVMSISSSVGEPIVTTVTSGTLTLTQGFQQPLLACPTITAVTIAPSATICAGNSVTISPVFTPVGGEIYIWSSGESTSGITIAPTLTTVYTFSVVGCTSTIKTQTITVNPIPATPTLTVSQNPVCAGAVLSLAASTFTGSPTYAWTGPNTFSVQNPVISSAASSDAGSYSVTVTVNGCTGPEGIVSVTVTPSPLAPNASATPNPVCEGQNINLSASPNTGATYSWNGPLAYTSATQASSIASATTAMSGTYSITATLAGCTGPAGTVSVTVNPIPTLSVTATDPLCNGNCNGTTTANASGGVPPYSYLWSIAGPTTSAISNLCPGPVWVVVTASGCSASATVTLTDPPILTASVSATQPLCGCNGNATATGSGGVSPYLYSWAPSSQSTQTATGLCINQIVTVTDKNGCTVNSGANITASPGVSVTATFTATICAGGSTTIGVNASTATGPLNYVWSPTVSGSGATVTVSPGGSTTYTVIITNSVSGCADTAFVPVSVSTTPTVSVSGTTTICSGQSATLGASAGSGATYLWNPGGQTDAVITTAALTSPTTFTVTATNTAGCTADGNISVSVTAAPTASVSVGPANSICNGTTVTLTASGGSTYFWINNSLSVSSFTDIPSANTTYTLVAYNGACSDTTTATVNVSSFSASISISNNDSVLCLGDNSILNATAGVSYLWNPGGATTQSIPISPSNTTLYFVTVTNASGCIGTDSMLVTVIATPTATITSSADTVCQFKSILLTANGGNTYQWTNGPATATYSLTTLVPGAHSYSVTVFSGTCSAGTTYAIYINSLPAVTASANPNSICPGGSATLSASSATSTGYLWFPGSLPGSTIIASPAASTTYTVGVIDANSCSNFALVPLTVDSVSVNAGADITICPGYTAELNAAVSGNISGITYLWSPDSLLNNPLIQNPSANPTDSATQFVVYVTNGLCSSSDSLMVYSIRTPDCIIHIYNGITPNGDLNNDVWSIDGIQSYPENKVLIFNRWGTRVWAATGYNNKNVVWKGTDEQARELPDGTYYYLVELYNGNGKTIFSESKWVEITR